MRGEEMCLRGHDLYGACELRYGHNGAHSRVPGGAIEANTWTNEPAVAAFVTKDSGQREEWDTGSRRDSRAGKGRYDLLPVHAVARLSQLLERGAVKYCQPDAIGLDDLVRACSCDSQGAILSGLSTLRISAEAAMSAVFDSETPSTPSDSGRARLGGPMRTRYAGGPPGSPTDRPRRTSDPSIPVTADGLDSGSLRAMASSYLLRRQVTAASASTSSAPGDPTSTTITRQDALEGFSVLVATRALASSGTRSSHFGEHSTTCPIRRLRASSSGGLEIGNERNWEKGQPLSRYLDSALRHAFQALDGREDEDHLAAAAWNVMACIETQHRIRAAELPAELDDLPDRRGDPRVNPGPNNTVEPVRNP